MLAEELRSLLHAQPFRPFTVHISDGNGVTVHHQDYAWLLPSGFQLIFESPEGKVHLINLSQVSQVTYDSDKEPAPTGGGVRS